MVWIEVNWREQGNALIDLNCAISYGLISYQRAID